MTERSNPSAWPGYPTRRQLVASFAIGLGGLALGATKAWAATAEQISHNQESIHQETAFNATRKRVYDARTDTKQFNKVVQLSGAMKSGMPPGAAPTEITAAAGGAFTLFGGYIVGRHIELVTNERIVQAWRVVDWDPGVYSIAKFVLVEQGPANSSSTTLAFPMARPNTSPLVDRQLLGAPREIPRIMHFL